MYNIDNFIEIKSEIYKYCRNLTLTRVDGKLIPHQDRADDLFQEVYLNCIDILPKLKKELTTLDEFKSKVKVITWWANCRRFNKKLSINKIILNLNYYQDSEKSEYKFNELFIEDYDGFKNINNNIDYSVYKDRLNKDELYILNKLIQGYTFKEIKEENKFNKNYFSLCLSNIENIETRYKSKVKIKVNNLKFLKQKIKIDNFNEIFNTKYKVNIYSMYLQGFSYENIGKKYKKSKNQIGIEIYRIKKVLNNLNG